METKQTASPKGDGGIFPSFPCIPPEAQGPYKAESGQLCLLCIESLFQGKPDFVPITANITLPSPSLPVFPIFPSPAQLSEIIDSKSLCVCICLPMHVCLFVSVFVCLHVYMHMCVWGRVSEGQNGGEPSP